MPPPRIRFHSLFHVRAAVAAASECGAVVVLESPPAAAGYWGPTLFLAMLDQAGGARDDAVLDCGDAPGHALAALRAGVKAVRLSAAPEVTAAVADIAEKLGARLETVPSAVLDLAVGPPRKWAEACRDWISRPG